MQRRDAILVLDGLLFLLLLLVAWRVASVLLAVAFVTVTVILWFKGFVRFRRLRRLVRNTIAATGQLVRTHRLSRRQLRNLAISIGVVALIVILNQLHLSAPGKGRGLSVPLDAFSFDFNVSSEGGTLATLTSYGLLFALLFLVWLRLWQSMASESAGRKPWFVAALAVFFAMPGVFALLLLAAPPVADPARVDQATFEKSVDANTAYSNLWLGVTQSLMAIAFCTAIALPHLDRPSAEIERSGTAPTAPAASR